MAYAWLGLGLGLGLGRVWVVTGRPVAEAVADSYVWPRLAELPCTLWRCGQACVYSSFRPNLGAGTYVVLNIDVHVRVALQRHRPSEVGHRIVVYL